MGKYIWMAVEANEYELPLAVADTAEELGRIFGVRDVTVINAVMKGFSGRQNGWKYVKVLNKESADAEDRT